MLHTSNPIPEVRYTAQTQSEPNLDKTSLLYYIYENTEDGSKRGLAGNKPSVTALHGPFAYRDENL